MIDSDAPRFNDRLLARPLRPAAPDPKAIAATIVAFSPDQRAAHEILDQITAEVSRMRRERDRTRDRPW